MDIVQFSKSIFHNTRLCNESRQSFLYTATTTKKYNSMNNYEMLEFLGDKLLNGMFASYCMTREPYCKMLYITNGQIIGTRLVIKYLGTSWLAKICSKIGLDKYIKCNPNEHTSMEIIREDVLEAWIGACKFIFGYDAVELFMFEQFDWLKLDLSFTSLFDSKSILNDFVSAMKSKTCPYSTHLSDGSDGSESIYFSQVKSTRNNIIGYGNGSSMKIAESCAAQDLLDRYKIEMGKEYDTTMNHIRSYQIWNTFNTAYNKRHVEDNDDICRKKIKQ